MKTVIVYCSCVLLSCSAALAASHYVDINNLTPSAPYTNWMTAANTIQDAVDATAIGETVVVTNGHYILSSEILVTNYITIQSVSGPDVTIVDGGGSVRGFNLGSVPCTISGFTITNGYATGSGGGIYCTDTYPVITNCLIIGNGAYGTLAGGGGVSGGTIKNCSIIANIANHGGGIASGSVYNSMIAGNTARYAGGGMRSCTAYNCTISGNSACAGGGMYSGNAYNCIIWDNHASRRGWNLDKTYVEGSCSPDLEHGISGNITNAPILVSSSHVAVDSPCRNAGGSWYTSGTDLDGETWLNPPSMGCDEYHGSATGLLYVAITGADKVVEGYPLHIGSYMKGAVTMHIWDFGDGSSATNNLYPVHVWNSLGTYELILTAFNDTYPGGVSSTQTVQVADRDSSALYVSLGGNDSNIGTNWSMAKATIQAGVDAQEYEGGLVWVTNGTYALTSEIKVNKGIVIQSVGGPESTIIDGQGITRCLNLGNTASTIAGLTITNGYAIGEGGGGVYCIGGDALITNCIVIGNTADIEGGGVHAGTVVDSLVLNNVANSPAYGGGGLVWTVARNCTVSGNTANEGGGLRVSDADNCIISGNTAVDGGGMYSCVANNCTIIMNTATNGGGMYNGSIDDTADNCIVWYNTAPSWPDLYSQYFPAANYSCSPSLPHSFAGNITNAPLFISAGNYRLATNSPCINAGSNGYVSVAYDLDSHPRIVDGSVDMGAYESGFDGFFITNCIPLGTETIVEWTAFPMWDSTVHWSSNLVTMPFADLSGSMAFPVNSFTDTVHGAASECFYRVDLEP